MFKNKLLNSLRLETFKSEFNVDVDGAHNSKS